jgi:glycosyltransferase involved in cell wall biosynthesis
MRIAQIAPLWELVPPRTYGGTELVVYNLTEGLVKRGHEVTLFAAAGSTTSAQLQPCAPSALRTMEERFKNDKTHCTVMGYELKMLEEVFAKANHFDVIHNHVGFQALPFANFVSVPVVTTLHNALEPEVVRELFEQNAQLPYISISNYQQKLWPKLNYAATIYHGIQMDNFRPDFEPQNKDYFVFLGRMSPEKGPHLAIQAAKALGVKLIMAGKVDRVDRLFYKQQLEHLIDGEQIQYIGEVDHHQKVELLRNAKATLFPILWAEPFGLVMIESMACGTPVFALRDGSVPEVIDHGKTGYIADSLEEMIEALRQWKAFDRRLVRKIAKRRFSAERMVDDHLRLYSKLVHQQEQPTPILAKNPLTPTRIAESKHSATFPNQTKTIASQAFEFTVLESGHTSEISSRGHSRGF